MVRDTEHEVRSNALEQLGSLARILSDNFNDRQLLTNIMEAAKDLLKDQSHHVRNSLISVLSKNLEYFTEEFINVQIPDMMITMLQQDTEVIPNDEASKKLSDENNKVKLTAIKNLFVFLPALGSESFKTKFIPELKNLVSNKNWKVRNAILELNSSLIGSKEFSDDLITEIIELNMLLKDDHAYCIRKSLIENIVANYNSSNSTVLDKYIKELLGYWASSNNYIFRVSVAQSLLNFSTVLSQKFFEEICTLVFGKLKDEKVSFNLEKFISNHFRSKM